jgi:acyl dehydratase
MRYFEDFAAGQEYPFGPHTVTRQEIVAFAAEFDPQPFHLDEVAASDSLLGGLAASGWHTCALFMRMVALGWLNDSASMGSPGAPSCSARACRRRNPTVVFSKCATKSSTAAANLLWSSSTPS